ncbi:MAG: CinA family nicotinamide mononucleotide deamidase-related protein [Bacteroidales bacterium]|nr:CinA family nicotinamide mononucleotide deamidase-related protein [Bacteroidales bacterium]
MSLNNKCGKLPQSRHNNNISIIVIGDEILIGQVTDTNSGDIARMVAPHGWNVNDVQAVGDNALMILQAIDQAFATSDIVLTTGGLGPTKDDITKSVLCQYFGGELRHDSSVLETVKEVVAKRHLKLNELTAAQAIVPSSCKVIQNKVGTAPIMWFEKDGKVLVSMPGVPFEMHQMFEQAVLPMLNNRFHSDVTIEHRTLLITNWSESQLAMEISDWEDALPPYIHLAYLPRPGIIRLRLDGTHTDKDFINQELDRCKNELIEKFGNDILHDDDLTPPEILLHHLRRLGLNVSTAESCTGGNIAHLITSIPGSSAVFNGSIVAYSNDVKQSVLNVKSETLIIHGAVSIPTVEEMATGACDKLATQCAIATSGIAGPDGGTADKPVGTVCIAVKTPLGIISQTRHFPGNRSRVIDQASTTAIIMLISQLKKIYYPHCH